MVDLEKLKEEITALGEKVKGLKEAQGGGGGDGVQAAVNELLAAKKLYADNNNGMGVDGKPYEPPMSRAEKKAKDKAKKAAAAAAAAGGGGGGDGSKKEGNDGSGGPGQAKKKGGGEQSNKQAAKQAKKSGASAGAPPASSSSPPIVNTSFHPKSGQVIMNPNAKRLNERPVVALSVAVLTNTVTDLTLAQDQRCRHTCLGVIAENQTGTREKATSVVTGDLAMARYLARRSNDTSVLPKEGDGDNDNDIAALASIDAWVDYAQSLTLLDADQALRAIAMTLGHALKTRTYLVGHTLTLADLALFSAAGFPTAHASLKETLKKLPEHAHVAARWLKMMAAHPALQEATQLCLDGSKEEAVFDADNIGPLDPLVPGMAPLEGAVAGRVVTRFPPEPSGYLHIGHAKAALLNDYYARRYKGRLILRFDDTNPSKEKQEFQDSIVEDLKKLGVTPDLLTFTSDYFPVIQEYAKALIRSGLAYMDDTPQEQMKTERLGRIEGKHRNTQTVEQALEYFDLMCSGKPEGAAFCLRAKVDMQSNNGTMRDPVLYRQNLEPHHRSGTTYKAYPTYDLACPIVDALEGVTHALRTTEYDDRNEQYQWILAALGLRRVRNYNFSRVNFEYTVLSKRKLTWFVNEGYVTGWDDPRFPTVRGVVRRGIDITALRSFMYAQGASRAVVNMVWNKFWAENKKEIDDKAKRFMAIDKEKSVELTVTNGPKEEDFAYKETTCHPKDPSLGKRAVRIASKVLLEAVDVEGIAVDENIVLLRWAVVKITKVDKDGDTIKSLEGEVIPDGDFKAPKRKLSWIANVKSNCAVVLHEFDHLVTKAKFEDEDKFEDFINPTTLATTDVIGDAGLKLLKEHDVIQLERRGYYRVDRPFVNADKPLMLFMVPDGKTKAMSGLAGKLAHH